MKKRRRRGRTLDGEHAAEVVVLVGHVVVCEEGVPPLEKEIQTPLREAGSPDHHDDLVDSDQHVFNKEHSLPTTPAESRNCHASAVARGYHTIFSLFKSKKNPRFLPAHAVAKPQRVQNFRAID